MADDPRPDEHRAPPTQLESVPPPTQLEGGAPPAPPTVLDGGAVGGSSDPPPTRIDGSDDDIYVRLPGPLRQDYEVVGELPSGGEGDLLLARYRGSDELRVVKIYRSDRRRDERALELLSDADPDHVVKIHESGQSGKRWWEVMEYCERGSLVELVAAEGPALPRERIEAIVAEVAAALEHVHSLKIPHRDLKPANILVRSVEPELDLVLADFGLARVLDLSKEMHSRLVISAAYAAPQTTSGAISPAMDWWSLGIIVAELALGRNPFQQPNGEWIDERVIMDAISSRPIELKEIEDAGLRELCLGLTRRDDRHGHRWGAKEVQEWLAGKQPGVADEPEEMRPQRKATSPFPFRHPADGRTKPFNDPIELAAAMAQDWDGACAVLDGSAAHRPEQRALRNFIRSLDLAEAEQVLAEQDDAEERLVRLLVALNPRFPPVFRGHSIDRDGLRALAESDSADADDVLEKVFSERILLSYARSLGHEHLAELDAAWHEELSSFERTLDGARDEEGNQVFANQRERTAARDDARDEILLALLEPEVRDEIVDRAAAAAADERALRQKWFADLAGARTGDG